MSRYKVKGNCEGVVKSIEFERGNALTLTTLKSALESKFKISILGMRFLYSLHIFTIYFSEIWLRYQTADGRTSPMYQDFHLADAMREAEKGKQRCIMIEIDKAYTPGSSSQRSAAPSQAPAQSAPQNAPRGVPKFCEECGATRAPNAK